QVSGHMFPNDLYPWLHGIYFEAEREFLYAVATDRHTVAATRRKLETGPGQPWSVFVPADVLKSVRAFARLNRRTPLHLDTAPDSHTGTDALCLRAEHQTLQVPGLAGERPSLWRGG